MINVPRSLMQDGRLRFGIMCNGSVFQRWQADAIRDLIKRGHKPVLLIIDAGKSDAGIRKRSIFRALLKKRNWNTILFSILENRLFRPDARRPVDLSDELAEVSAIGCRVEKRGYSEYFDQADIGKVKACNPDFILRFGFGIIRGEILDAARFGVWSFHHDDEEKYRGGPAGFWEIFYGDPVSGSILQRLNERLDAGMILQKGYLKTINHSWKAELEQLLSVTAAWPGLVADRLARNPEAVFETSRSGAPVFRVPRNGKMIRFLWRLALNKIKFHFGDLFRPEDWSIGIINRPVADIALGKTTLKNEDIHWIPPQSRGIYQADPAGFVVDGNLHILAEHYSYAEGRGKIVEVDPDQRYDPAGVISTDHHCSYPYVLEYQGNIYCIPESFRSGKVTLYRRDPADGRFRLHKTLLDGIPAVDPTLISHNGLWWLFFTEQAQSNTHLFVYYSDEPDGNFRPHAENPVKIDVRSARPAGTPFFHEGVLYRPAQDSSVTYGGRIAVNRVIELSESNFRETTIATVESLPASLYPEGMHTISGVGGITLVDGKRYRFNRHHFLWHLRKKLKL